MSADSYALRQCLRMIRHCLDREERRRLALALALREERVARMAELRHRIRLICARSLALIDK
jgi:hypothetical protein